MTLAGNEYHTIGAYCLRMWSRRLRFILVVRFVKFLLYGFAPTLSEDRYTRADVRIEILRQKSNNIENMSKELNKRFDSLDSRNAQSLSLRSRIPLRLLDCHLLLRSVPKFLSQQPTRYTFP